MAQVIRRHGCVYSHAVLLEESTLNRCPILQLRHTLDVLEDSQHDVVCQQGWYPIIGRLLSQQHTRTTMYESSYPPLKWNGFSTSNVGGGHV